MAFPVKYIHCPLKSNKKVSLRDILLIHLCILLHAHIEAADYIFLVGLFCRNLSCDSLTLKPDGGFDPWSNHLMTCNIVDVPFFSLRYSEEGGLMKKISNTIWISSQKIADFAHFLL